MGSRSSGSGKTRTSPEEFVRIWQTSRTRDEAARRMGVSRVGATTRAILYRRRGVRLKLFSAPRKNPARLDVDALNALIAGLESEQ